MNRLWVNLYGSVGLRRVLPPLHILRVGLMAALVYPEQLDKLIGNINIELQRM